MPHYAKFMKDILSKKKNFVEEGVVSLSVTCSAIIQNLPLKIQDLGGFTIPCTIGNYEFGRALCDLGASINLMPLSMVKRLSLGEFTPTTMTLHMVDITMAQLEGILEDALIKVGNFIFPVDFVVIDIEEDKQVPLLLGRLFLFFFFWIIKNLFPKGQSLINNQEEYKRPRPPEKTKTGQHLPSK